MKQEVFVVINSENKTVRHLHWEGNELVVILDSGRMEFVSPGTLKSMDDSQIQVLKTIKKSEVKNRSIICAGGLKVAKKNEENVEVVYGVETKIESNSRFKEILRKTALVHMIVLLCLLVTSYFYKPQQPQEARVITVVPQKRIKIKKKVKTVALKKKIKKSKTRKIVKTKKRPKKVKKARTTRIAKKSLKRKRGVKAGRNTTASFLGALDGLHAGKKSSSLRMGSVNGKKSKHISTGSRGSSSRLVPGKALVASTQGSGRNLGHVSSYKTRGQGGQGGYGKMALSGAKGIYSAPLKEEAYIDGGLDRSQIDAVVKRNIGQITFCYEKGLQRDSDLSGRVAVKFIINPKGRVSMSKVHRSSLGSKSVESCILAKLNRWKFPRPYGNVNVKVTYPFSLKRAGVTNLSRRGQ